MLTKDPRIQNKQKEDRDLDRDVVELREANFDELVYGTSDVWLVLFYAPWCGHCKKIKPEWNEAASKLRGKVRFGKVDVTVQKQLGHRFRIKGYPTIKFWNYGPDKNDGSSLAYSGGRTTEDI